MKPEPTLTDCSWSGLIITRKRAAYLLRAARSRRRHNIQRQRNQYYIVDGNTTITLK